MLRIKEFYCCVTIVLTMLYFIQFASAGGFQNSQTSVTGLGRAYAGAGIIGDDLSDMFYNPAGLTLSKGMSIQQGFAIVDSSTRFRNQGSNLSLGSISVSSTGAEDDAGTTSLPLPIVYYSRDVNSSLRFGFGITTPFGLGTEYNDNWIGRYHALKSELRTVNVNPNLSWKASDKLSLGLGISAQYANVELSRAVFTGLMTPDGKSTLDATDWGFGFNLGGMYEFNENSRLGIGIRSKIKHSFKGDLEVELPGQPQRKFDASSTLNLPESVYLSYFHRIGSIELLAGARWTNWNRYDELRVNFNNVLPDLVEPQEWDDSWTLSAGLNYKVNEDLILRAGYSYDQTPIPDDSFRSPRSPDQDKHLFSLGAGFKVNKNWGLDVAYSRSIQENASINTATNLVATQPNAVISNLVGEYESDANLFGLQIRCNANNLRKCIPFLND